MGLRGRYLQTASVLAFALSSVAGMSAAQTAAPGASAPAPTGADQATEVGEVVVTGSRLRNAGFTAPTPTTVVGGEVLDALTTTNVSDALNQLPAFRADYSAAAAGNRSVSVGTAYANLRSLGSTRTLTLIDGRRVVPSAVTGQADLNLVPAILIDRVDVVTGGASAAFGSDAVAGVVNVILDTDLDGFKFEGSYGLSSHGDNEEVSLGLAGGTTFASGRGRIFAGGEFVDNKGADSMYSRDWGRDEYAVINNPTPADGRGALLVLPHVHFSTMSPGGMINAGVLRGLQFLPNGATSQFQYGANVGPSTMTGGQGYGETTYTSLISPPIERGNVLGHVDFDFSDRISGFVEAAYAYSDAVARGAQPRDTAITIRRDNAYLPESVRAAMVAADLQTITVGRQSYDVGFSTNVDNREIQRYVGGLQGSLGDTWKWDAYYQFGKTNYRGELLNGRNNALWLLSVDAVTDDSGQIVCRSSLAAPGNGCVPANIFGDGSISAEAKAYFTGDQIFELEYTQKVAAANITGEPFSNWAGPVSVAAGAEYREEDASGVSDPLAQASAYNIGNQKAIEGAFDVKEAYAEIGMPVFRDWVLGQSLDLNGAVRVTDYSTSGTVTTWKVGGVWDINPEWRLRATRSRDIRAPNISELFTQSAQVNQTIRNPATLVSSIIPNITTGNPDLQPEIADTLTGGVVYRPAFLPGFTTSIDAYDIQIDDAVSQVAAQDAVNRCFAGVASFCDFVIRDGAGVITSVNLPFINLASIKTTGVDFEASYRMALEDLSPRLPGSLNLRLFANYVDRLVVDDGTVSVDRAGEVGNGRLNSFNVPKWRWNVIAGYSVDRLEINLIERYVGGGKFDNTYTAADINDNSVDARFYTDVSGSFDIATTPGGQPVQLFGIVKNLFDKDPPIAPQVSAIPTNATLYDTIGRTFKVGLRMSF